MPKVWPTANAGIPEREDHDAVFARGTANRDGGTLAFTAGARETFTAGLRAR